MAVAALAGACLDATAIRVDVSTEVDCGKNAPVVIVAGHDLDDLQTLLASAVVTSSRAGCLAADGTVGDLVLTPATVRDAPVSFAVMTRIDGQPPDHCGDPTLPQIERNQCIVAKRSLRFSPHATVDVVVPLRLSCAGVVCPSDQTCVQGLCVSAGCGEGNCSEIALKGAANMLGVNQSVSCALEPNQGGAELRCWGAEDPNNINGSTVPTLVYTGVGLDAPMAFAANGNWTCVVLKRGEVRCSGYSYMGTQEGLGLVTVPGLSDARSVVQGESHTCALLRSGKVTCWGNCGWGQCPGATHLVTGPVEVPGLVGVTALTSGARHICALLKGGSVHCWGYNTSGQLGTASTQMVDSPLPVPGLLARDISAGGMSTCAVRMDGTVACWGANQTGSLGDGTTTDRNVPVTVFGLSGVRRVSTSGGHTCALLADETMFCWGDNTHGQVGDGTTKSRLVAGYVPGQPLAQLATGAGHTCAVTTAGAFECWGDNTHGQLGIGTTDPMRLVPTPVIGLP